MTGNYVLTLACLASGLLFDPNGFLRMVLVSSLLHESGHVLVYCLFRHRLPPLQFCAGGISMGELYLLPAKQERILALAGPLANFIVAFFVYLLILRHAAYGLYFFMAINLCVGFYNLLPFGVLDGARILKSLVPTCKEHLLYTVQKCLLAVFFVLCAVLFFTQELSPYGRVAIVLAPIYLLFCELSAK